MGLFRRLFDKCAARFIASYLARADERDLHPQRILLEQAQEEAAAYAQAKMKSAIILKTRDEVLAFALRQVETSGLVLEFGVANGDSIRLIADKMAQKIHGFDSFEGLPENWAGRHEGKGHYSTGGRLPVVPANVVLYKGWFEHTLPEFLQNNGEPVAFLHVDCDLYSSTKTAFAQLASRIVPGTIIVFDEYFNFVSWRDHEYKAFQEFVSAHNVTYSYLCWGYQQVVVRIDGIRAA
ncbi:MAG: class I SAM-dependent methyltransferase [Rhodospirillales bacterium]|nr:class I SAM-dependent methyltransferase [Rhodospirillales bacterium]